MFFTAIHLSLIQISRSLGLHFFSGGGGSCRRQGKSAAPHGGARRAVLVGSVQGGEWLTCNTIYNVFYVLRTVRRAAEGEPPRLEGGVPVHRKTFILVASTVSHSPAFPR